MSAPDYDVAVVGGGSAGIAAAVCAARMGARTLLLERETALGGNASQAFVHTICGLYLAADDGAACGARPAHPGFPARFAGRLRAAGAAGEPERAGRVWVLPTDPPRIPALAAALCAETPGLELRAGCPLVGASLGAESGETQQLELGDGRRLAAAILLDTSGDAVAAALGRADVECAGPEELQLPSLIFRMAGVDTREIRGFGRLRVTRAVAGAARDGELPAGCESVLVRPALAAGEVHVTLNLPRPSDFDPLDPGRRAELETQAREGAVQLAEFLRRTRPAFRASRIQALPARIGIRETRRVTGRAAPTRADVIEGRRPPDQVALSTWPIELWSDHRRAVFEYPRAACGIPLGALISRSHPGLGMAGRCLSASREALGALRVIGTALATGEAAGVAAALAADRGRGLDSVAAQEVRDHILRLAEEVP